MRKVLKLTTVLMVALATILSLTSPSLAAKPDVGASIGMSPTKIKLQIEAGKEYDGTFKVANGGTTTYDFKVYASPYQIGDEETYQPNFDKETKRTQITRWISFDQETYTAKPSSTTDVAYHIKVPKNIPDGGQYAVLFAQTIESSNGGGVIAAKRVGVLLYAKTDGKTIEDGELIYAKVSPWQTDGLKISFKAENRGNTDFELNDKLVVETLGGKEVYNSGVKPYTLLPETTRTGVNEWTDAPKLGLFWVTQEAQVLGKTETVKKLVLIAPIFVPIVFILAIAVIIVLIALKARSGKKYGKKVRRLSR
jgi:hypothetical protein